MKKDDYEKMINQINLNLSDAEQICKRSKRAYNKSIKETKQDIKELKGEKDYVRT